MCNSAKMSENETNLKLAVMRVWLAEAKMVLGEGIELLQVL